MAIAVAASMQQTPKFRCLPLFLVMLSACPTTPSSTGSGGDGPDGGPGGGNGGVVDLGCDGDDGCAAGLVCDLDSATCIAGLSCAQNAGVCTFCGSPEVDCGFGNAAAFCDAEAGVCRRNKGQCEGCLEDAECAPASTGLPSVCSNGACATGCGACPPGYSCEAGGCVIRPTIGSCDTSPSCSSDNDCSDGQTCALSRCLSLCASDDQCPAGTVCSLDSGPAQQTCVAGCPLGTRAQQDGQPVACHADGRFGPVCPGAADTTEGCPSGLSCRGDGVCELPGCQSDTECPLSRTYCDLATAACVQGCNSDDDCGAFELCADNQCAAQGCRSKDTSCNAGQFCCGAELYDDATTCPSGVVDGICFLAPDPFCRTCVDNDDCSDISSFGFGSQCFELRRQNAAGEEQVLGSFCSVGCRDNDDCPRDLRCVADLEDANGAPMSGCLDVACAALAGGRP